MRFTSSTVAFRLVGGGLARAPDRRVPARTFRGEKIDGRIVLGGPHFPDPATDHGGDHAGGKELEPGQPAIVAFHPETLPVLA